MNKAEKVFASMTNACKHCGHALSNHLDFSLVANATQKRCLEDAECDCDRPRPLDVGHGAIERDVRRQDVVLPVESYRPWLVGFVVIRLGGCPCWEVSNSLVSLAAQPDAIVALAAAMPLSYHRDDPAPSAHHFKDASGFCLRHTLSILDEEAYWNYCSCQKTRPPGIEFDFKDVRRSLFQPKKG